jgi:hypothetical protein
MCIFVVPRAGNHIDTNELTGHQRDERDAPHFALLILAPPCATVPPSQHNL